MGGGGGGGEQILKDTRSSSDSQSEKLKLKNSILHLQGLLFRFSLNLSQEESSLC